MSPLFLSALLGPELHSHDWRTPYVHSSQVCWTICFCYAFFYYHGKSIFHVHLSSEIQSSSCLSLHFLNFRIRVDFFSACLFIHEPTPPLCVSAFSIESFSPACNTHLILLLLTSSLLEKVTSWWHFAHRD